MVGDGSRYVDDHNAYDVEEIHVNDAENAKREPLKLGKTLKSQGADRNIRRQKEKNALNSRTTPSYR